MKNMYKILITIILLFIPFFANAETKIITTYTVDSSDGLNLREGPGTTYSIVKTLTNNTELQLIEKGTTGNGCSNMWYKVKINSVEGYACSTYIKETTREVEVINEEDYEKLLNKFPDSYKTYLNNLHKLYPNWIFVPFNTNLDWNYIVDLESIKGRSLIWYSYGEGYRSKEPYSYNYETDTYYRHTHETNWWYASKEAVAYYMDPRNYLNSDGIFSFEALSYEKNFQTAEVVEKIMNGSFMPSVYAKYSTDPYTKAFIDGASLYDVSPIHLASRIIQEQGFTGSVASSGEPFTYNGKTYSSLFNFFNIKAYGEGTVYNGLIWAEGGGDTSYGRPWNTPYKAILGGAQFLSEDYIGPGQDTLYFQKFNVTGTNGGIYHQYQTNIMAPYTEGMSTKKSYSKITGLLDKSLVFRIPVYNNMSSSAVKAPQNLNPNSYLKSITIDGKNIEGFKYNILDYSYNTTNDKINLLASTINSNAKIEKPGDINLQDGENIVKILVTAQDNTKTTYTLTINKVSSSTGVLLNDIMNNSGIKYNDDIIHGINAGTNVNSLVENIKKYSSLANVIIKDSKGNIKNNSNFVTGDKVTVIGTDQEKTYTVIIYGDNNGDGVIDKLDSLAVLRDYYNYFKLQGAFKISADANRDGVIDKLDSLAVLRQHYGYFNIKQ